MEASDEKGTDASIDASGDAKGPSGSSTDNLQFSDFELPTACVQRVMKAVLPDNVQVSKEAKVSIYRGDDDDV